MASVSQAFGDAQTTIACLASGVAGAVSDELGGYLVSMVSQEPVPGLGAVGLEFCARAVISAAVFGQLHSWMPETSSNIFFSILFFAANRGLVNSALQLSRGVVGATKSLTTPARRSSAPPKANPTTTAPGGCTTGCK